MLTHTSTPWAPWYVAPADHKWFTPVATAAIVAQALRAVNPQYPSADPAAAEEMAKARSGLLAELAASPR